VDDLGDVGDEEVKTSQKPEARRKGEARRRKPEARRRAQSAMPRRCFGPFFWLLVSGFWFCLFFWLLASGFWLFLHPLS
jgi:hypothetical protein